MRTGLWLALLAAGMAAASRAPQGGAVSLVRAPNGGIQPQAVADGRGVVHLLYFAGDPKHGDLFYVKSRDYGATWSSPLRVNSRPGAALAVGTIRGGQLAVGKNGRVHVAWNGSSATEAEGPMNPEAGRRGAPMLYSRLNDTGTAFEPERNLMTRTFGLDGGGAVAADAAGNVYVAWHGKSPGAAAGEAGRQVWVAVSHDEGKTFAPEHPAWNQPTGACACCGMAIFADSQGTVRALYRSATEGVHRDMYLLSSTDEGASFQARKLHEWEINACPMSSMELAEGGGQVAGAWETKGQVYFENLTASSAAPVSGAGEGAGRKHPRIAIGPNGETLMIWTEGTGWQRGGSLAWQLYDASGRPVGEKGLASGVPAWSFGAVTPKPGGFLIIY
ncbi:MAG TPA: sialidase family protein [Bryobacteraceae bacterium]|nr:sialidase family protein [Bryobacteraceae bacterium]